ncbi:hypothetical protein SAMN04244553_0429 [Nocardia amikacinitolerans]|uniref:Uncharacterized protein n=1 Tax=Nocardia amikacinitolerans TaxID=756689 RepID=A0A285KV80_9NOCA|nr:hypothetical protein [Nocardia amikacinitolerans]SNY75121.1 hypothetical protein SAMN04244553_0429 [Nocardia amikacinitolerans]
MTSGARAFLVAGAAAGALGVGLVPIAGSTPTNSEPAWPTDTTECCDTSYVPPSTDPPVTVTTIDPPVTTANDSSVATTTNDPPVTTANDSSVATTTNDPQEATTTDPQATATTAQPTVPTTTGSFVAPPFGTTSPTARPILTTITQSAVQPPFDTGSPTASPVAEEKQQDSRLGDALGVGAFLLALGGAALVTRRRRGRPAGPAPEHARDALPPQLRVRVVGDIRPSIHVREVAGVGAPAVRVLLTVGEPWLQVREVP